MRKHPWQNRLYTHKKSTSTRLPVKIHRKPVSNCAYPTKHEENVKIFFLTCLSTIFRWILNREHIFARDAEFIPDGGFAVKLGDAKDLVFLCYENQERRISWKTKVRQAQTQNLHGYFIIILIHLEQSFLQKHNRWKKQQNQREGRRRAGGRGEELGGREGGRAGKIGERAIGRTSVPSGLLSFHWKPAPGENVPPCCVLSWVAKLLWLPKAQTSDVTNVVRWAVPELQVSLTYQIH